MAASVCRIIKRNHPGLRINLITKWPDLPQGDPALDLINGPEGVFTLRFWYLETVVRKERYQNVLSETLAKLGITNYEYDAKVYLTVDEKSDAKKRLTAATTSGRPLLAICSRSKERVKDWPLAYWEILISRVRARFELIHLGDDREPAFEGVQRFAGTLSMRDSMAVLSHCDAFVGPDSFLMHAAKGVDVPSVIIFGGARPSACLGYEGNINLYVPMPCGPCWLHDSRGDVCPDEIACMDRIRVEDVEAAISDVLAQRTRSVRIRDSLVYGG
jgi:ADP-heptose:LPS heptosyltransferase